jgi:hypothetical protein
LYQVVTTIAKYLIVHVEFHFGPNSGLIRISETET